MSQCRSKQVLYKFTCTALKVKVSLVLFQSSFLGESGVGKSSHLLRFTDDAFDAEQAATIGVDFKVKTITINGDKVSFHDF